MNNLKKLRNKRGLSRAGLAELTGINARSILAWERGENDLQRAAYCTVTKLAKALEVTPDYLIGGTDT